MSIIYLGATYLGGENTLSPTPTYVQNIKQVKIQGGYYDELFITKDVTGDLININPNEWDLNTILHAKFEGTIFAGNVDVTLDTISHVLIKKRQKGEHRWTTIKTFKIATLDDFDIHFDDFYYRNFTWYQYCIVLVINGVEGKHVIKDVYAKFDKTYIMEKDAIFGIAEETNPSNTVRIMPSQVITMYDNEYAAVYSNSIANYDTGNTTGYFVQINQHNCKVDTDNVHLYKELILKFLSNGNIKILKTYDGRIKMINITGNLTDTFDRHYLHRLVGFDWAECGNCLLERDLYINNLSDVGSEWW